MSGFSEGIWFLFLTIIPTIQPLISRKIINLISIRCISTLAQAQTC
jgi:hypothetical protein